MLSGILNAIGLWRRKPKPETDLDESMTKAQAKRERKKVRKEEERVRENMSSFLKGLLVMAAVAALLNLALAFHYGLIGGGFKGWVVQLATRRSLPEPISAIYVFGDSTTDTGNNNHYGNNAAKADFSPYGIDFDGGLPTGRFTNGKTAADFIAEYHGLPLLPAYYNLSHASKKETIKGMSYGSGGCGVLPSTRPEMNQDIMCTSLPDQVNLFSLTLNSDLKTHPSLQDAENRTHYLNSSLFYVSSGANDLMFYFNETKMKAEVFVALLVGAVKTNLQGLYDHGARKFIVSNVGPLGCIPMVLVERPNGTCDGNKNNLVESYNTALERMLQDLVASHRDLAIKLADSYKLLSEMISGLHGFKNTASGCCAEYNEARILGCHPNSTPCAFRDHYIFYDAVHPSQRANRIFVDECFKGRICKAL